MLPWGRFCVAVVSLYERGDSGCPEQSIRSGSIFSDSTVAERFFAERALDQTFLLSSVECALANLLGMKSFRISTCMERLGEVVRCKLQSARFF